MQDKPVALITGANKGIGLQIAKELAAHERGTAVPWMHLWSGPEAAGFGPPQWAYRPQTPQILQDGDIIAARVFSSFGMRQTQHQVTIAIGEVHKELERDARVARATYDAGLQALRAKTPFGDVAEAMLKPVEAAGGWVRGPQIHGLNPYGSLCRFPGNLSQVPGAERYPHVAGRPTGAKVEKLSQTTASLSLLLIRYP